jgi:MinD-like ATPase involved in chromosome partitioning or flagellar assembly
VRLAHLLEMVDDEPPHVSPVVLVNRVRGSVVGRRPEAQLEQTLARVAPARPAYLIPDDPAAVDRALRRGQPVTDAAPSSGLTVALERLVDDVLDPAGGARGVPSSAQRRHGAPHRWSRDRRSIA